MNICSYLYLSQIQHNIHMVEWNTTVPSLRKKPRILNCIQVLKATTICPNSKCYKLNSKAKWFSINVNGKIPSAQKIITADFFILHFTCQHYTVWMHNQFFLKHFVSKIV